MKEITKELQLRKIEKNKEMYYSKALKLGKGAFGQVFLGFDESSHLPFACKIISLQKINAQENQQVLIKKIKDQIVNMQIARNQHIVQFYQAKTSERNIYILCEYCNGDNLEKYLKHRGYLTQFEALTYFREILLGFYNLRERNIVHRDIKPANLLMHNYSLKIADLGFSKSIQNHDQLLESIVGSPLYMSPQIFERKKYTEKTDIWSLGVIFYQMLYGKNPFSGCMNLMELKERVKKDINFPKYPYVSNDTKKMIKRIMVVEEKDRIDWEFLFNKYLLKPSTEPTQPLKMNFYSISNKIYWYFRESYYIESYQHLHKTLKTIKLSTEQQLNKVYPFYESNEQFFTQIYFCSTNKQFIDEYYSFFIERRNRIAYLIVICNKLSILMGQSNNQQLLVFTYCIYLLVYKYSLALLQEMVSNQGKLILFDNKFQNIYNRFCYQKFMVFLLTKDRQLIESQLNYFTGHFRSMMSSLTQRSPQLLATIQRDLSGIYTSQHGDRRVINLYLNNYFKKIHSVIRNMILVEKDVAENKMISEQQQDLEVEEQDKLPPLTVTTCKLIQEYLNNPDLFNLKIQDGNRNAGINTPSFHKNLNQILYDYQTTLRQNYFQHFQTVKPFEQQSIISFMSKQIKWNNIFMPKLI